MKRVSIARIAIALGIILGTGCLLEGALLVWEGWITPSEKKDIRQALDGIDKVRSFRGEQNDEFAHQTVMAMDAVKLCKKQAVTGYDSRMVMLVDVQLDTALKEQQIWRLPDSSPHKQQLLNVLAQGDRKMEAMIRSHVMQ